MNVKKCEKSDRFLYIPEESGISKFLMEDDNYRYNGGRPSYNPCHLLATILYEFAFGKGSLRDIEDSCKHDLRYIYVQNPI